VLAPGRPDVIFFDVGGTLLNFSVEPSELFSRILAGHGVPVPALSLYQTMRAVEAKFPLPLGISAASEGAYWRAYDEQILTAVHAPPIPGLLDEVQQRFRDELRLDCFPESTEVLEDLSRRAVPLGVISNASHGILGDLERNGIKRFFDHVVYSQSVGVAKPDPRIFREALARFHVGAERAWHVGDNVEADIAGARAVGIRPILVDRGHGRDSQGATVVRDLRGLLAMMEDG
jgi:HAD superfamily hydrolase (TIGR01549 family)